jgi:hypothetical protein
MGRQLDPNVLNPVEEAANEYVMALRHLNGALFLFTEKQQRDTYHNYQDAKAVLKEKWVALKKLMSDANQRKHI